MILQYVTGEAQFFNTPHPLDFRDDFEADGNLNGREGWTVQTRSTFGSQMDALAASDGGAGGTTGSAAFAWHETSAPGARVSRVLGANLPKDTGTLGAITSHLSLDTGTITAFWFNLSRVVSGGVDTGAVAFQHLKNVNSGTNIQNIGNLRYENGDVFTELWDAAAKTMTLYMNGRQAYPTIDVTAHVAPVGTGVPLNGRFGLRGDHGASTYLDFWASSGDEAWVMGYMPNRVVRINAAGGGDWHIPVSYNGVIGDLHYAIYDVADDSAAVGWTLAELDDGALDFSTSSAQTPSSSSYYVMLRRKLGNGNFVYWRGPYQRLGIVVLLSGQSNSIHSANQTSTTAIAIATTCWRIDGRPIVAPLTHPSERRQLPQAADKVISHFGQTLAALAGGLPVACITAGQSSTSIALRLPGGTIYESEMDGIAHAGGRISIALETGGEGETDNLSNFKAQLAAKWDAVALVNGGDLTVILDPMNKSWTNADSGYQPIRRGHHELTVERSDRFVGGAHGLDIRNHDSLHYATSTVDTHGSQAIKNARAAKNVAFHLGYVSEDYRGPILVGFEKIDAQTLRWEFAVGDFDNIALPNTASGNFHGGTRASNSPDLSSSIWPTGEVTDPAPVGGVQGINMTYPSGSFPGDVYGGFGWGANPPNPLQDSATNSTTWATTASYVMGEKSGQPSVGARPYYGASVDYMMAS